MMQQEMPETDNPRCGVTWSCAPFSCRVGDPCALANADVYGYDPLHDEDDFEYPVIGNIDPL